MAVLTISRHFGAGAISLGRIIAEELGYAVVDDDIIQQVAEKANVSPQWVESIEREAGSTLLKFMKGVVPKSIVDHVLNDEHGYIDEDLYIDHLVEIIKKIANEGNVVIIGRGSQYILSDFPDAFHILLVAEKENRIGFMEKKYKLSRKEAEKTIKFGDRKRKNLYYRFHKSDYDMPMHYHLVLNMSKLDLETAARQVIHLITGTESIKGN